MKTKNEIIAEIYNSEIYNTILNNFNTHEIKHPEDLKQEMFCILLEKDESLIINAYNNNTLKYYFIRILINQTRSKTSPFYRKYRKERLEKIEDCTSDNIANWSYDPLWKLKNYPSQESSHQFDILKYVNEHKILNWYENEIFIIYYKLDSNEISDDKVTLRSMEKEYGITFNSIKNTLDRIIKKIKKHVEKNNIELCDY